jgi:hypothetical protein
VLRLEEYRKAARAVGGALHVENVLVEQ